MELSGVGGSEFNLVSALAPFGLVEVGAEIGAELDNCKNGIGPLCRLKVLI